MTQDFSFDTSSASWTELIFRLLILSDELRGVMVGLMVLVLTLMLTKRLLMSVEFVSD